MDNHNHFYNSRALPQNYQADLKWDVVLLINKRRQTTVLIQLGTIQTILCSVVTPKKVTRAAHNAQRSIFDEIRGVWIADETLSRVFDISSQSKQKLKDLNRAVKSSKSMLIKTGYPNLLHGCDFICFNLMNYL